MIKPQFTPTVNVKVLINIGSLMDIPTGFYLTGKYGESILNGGLGLLSSVVGIGNNFKSTIMHYMMLSAAAKIYATTETYLTTYDTEINIHEEHLRTFLYKFNESFGSDLLSNGQWVITDKTIYYANEWFEILKSYLKDKMKEKDITMPTPFLTRNNMEFLEIPVPTFSEIDSFSEFETADVAKIKDDNELGDSGGNTIHMRQGLAKTRFLMEVPSLLFPAYHFLLMTAQIGKDIQIATGPMNSAPIKKLQYLKNGDKLKGVTDKFTFLMSSCWHAYNATPLLNNSTKAPEYPKLPSDQTPNDLDLNTVYIRQLRSKSGPSGNVIELLVSQKEGVLPSLTEFHYIKSMDRFGISGTMQNYVLDILPDVKLSRTTVRSKLDSNPMLRRATNITAELCQMHQLWKHLDANLLCTPKTLYDDLIKLGYHWEVLLNTRGWWTLYNDKITDKKPPFLSTMDLLNMRQGTYSPYWLNEDKKSIKQQYM